MSKTTTNNRRLLIAGNWKLYKTLPEAEELALALKQSLGGVQDCDVLVAPPYTALARVSELLKGSAIQVAAQEIFYLKEGAYTGAVSAPHVKAAGCKYTLVGHSERRALFGETLETSYLRTEAALAAGLIPILCVGENLAEREAKAAEKVVCEQLAAVFTKLDKAKLKELIVAYEPVWAIGTGKVATPAEAEDMHATIRHYVAQNIDKELALHLRILYGGSVKADNAAELLRQADIDGLLVGGASLQATSFTAIVEARRPLAVSGNT